MATKQELSAAITNIRHYSDDITVMIGNVSSSLNGLMQTLIMTFDSKQSTRDAAQSLMYAMQELDKAAGSMRTLSATCEEYQNVLNR